CVAGHTPSGIRPSPLSKISQSSCSPTWRPLFLFSRPRGPLRASLFPYTTLFRSHRRSWSFAAVSAGRSSRRRGVATPARRRRPRSEEHTSELQSLRHLVCRLLLEKKKKNTAQDYAQDALQLKLCEAAHPCEFSYG